MDQSTRFVSQHLSAFTSHAIFLRDKEAKCATL